MRTAAFITLGCKINQYETEAIREEVLSLGYGEVPPTEPADVYVVNTCAVTSESASKSRKAVLRAARTSPQARIVVVGCSTASEKKLISRIPQVVFLAGNEEKSLVGDFLNGGWKPGEPFPGRAKDLLSLNISRYADRTRANVKVQDGCNSFCSFCVIPFLRGRSKSRHPDAVVEEVHRLSDNGYREVVITGVHIQDYGKDLEPEVSLSSLLRRLGEVSGILRVRISSIGVKAFTPELLEILRSPVFCPHWHIPLQAGSDEVLKRMRRDYTVSEFRQVVADLRATRENPAISTDVIVGHPGETEALFDETLEACREIGFAKIHVFPFSVREGTLASKLGGHVDPSEIRRRAKRLRELEEELGCAYKRKFLGETVDVLVEGKARGPGDGVFKGGAFEGGGSGDGSSGDGSSGDDSSGDDSSGDGGLGDGGLEDGGLEDGGLEETGLEETDALLEGSTDRYVKVRFPSPSARAQERFPGTIQPVRITSAGPAEALGEWAGRVTFNGMSY